MDVKTRVALLQAYGAYLSQRFLELSASVKPLDHPVKAQGGHTAPEIEEMAGAMVEEQRQLLTDAEVFCQRVTRALALCSQQTNGSLDAKETEYF